ncbi:probable N-acetyltransferase camello isoform X2 [Ambystoma mexicanum]|uniref:probable N-acetyltransferase camello isoform X2 n=1 Tax=Ambystoma mexicanum TaxID=8296 RepID=UPI0037E82626
MCRRTFKQTGNASGSDVDFKRVIVNERTFKSSVPEALVSGQQPHQDKMVKYKIRKYGDSDYDAVRAMFASGMNEYIPSVCLHVLKQPWVIFVILCIFSILLVSSKSLLLPILAITLLLAAGRQLVGYVWSLYIDQCLTGDLQDIQKTYMESKGSCFWVAEVEDVIVGTVAAKPIESQDAELQLKRMSVRKDFRGFGVAKALSRIVIDFARQHDFESVVLNTLMVQHEAKKMYEGVGFRKYLDDDIPSLYGKLFHFTISKYRYDVLSTNS